MATVEKNGGLYCTIMGIGATKEFFSDFRSDKNEFAKWFELNKPRIFAFKNAMRLEKGFWLTEDAEIRGESAKECFQEWRQGPDAWHYDFDPYIRGKIANALDRLKSARPTAKSVSLANKELFPVSESDFSNRRDWTVFHWCSEVVSAYANGSAEHDELGVAVGLLRKLRDKIEHQFKSDSMYE